MDWFMHRRTTEMNSRWRNASVKPRQWVLETFVTKTSIVMKKLIFGVCPCAQESTGGENHLYKTHAVNTLTYLSYHLLCVPNDGSIIFWNSFEVKSNRNIIKWKIAFLQNAEPQCHQQCITHWKCHWNIGQNEPFLASATGPEHPVARSAPFHSFDMVNTKHKNMTCVFLLSLDKYWPLWLCGFVAFYSINSLGEKGSRCLSAQENNHNNAVDSRNMSLQRLIRSNPGQRPGKNVKKVTKYLRKFLKG